MDAATFIANTVDLLKDGEFETVYQNIDGIDPNDFDPNQALELVQLLRSCRQFPAIEKSASVFAAGGNTDVTLRRHWALALIEQNRITQALSIARVAIPQLESGDVERSEMLGVLGRGHKQRFIETGNPEDLQDAIDAYQQGWTATVGDQDWHGINLVALQEHAKRDAVDVQTNQSSEDIARKILVGVNAKSNRQPWDLANAMEASLVIDTPEQTLEWAKAYVSHKDTDAFAIGGTLRQLREVWNFDETPIGRSLKPVLEYELLQRPGGCIEIESASSFTDTSGFEAVYGSESFTHVQWLENLFSLLDSVARIRDRRTGQPVGTGFLIDGKAINESWAGDRLLVTNSHVVSDDPRDEAAVLPQDAVAEFTRRPGQPRINLGTKRLYSERSKLDVWICEIDVDDEFEPLSVSSFRPLAPSSDTPPQRIFVVGHPSGADLVVSLFNNDLVGYDDPYVHYKSPTMGGSSGSPVLAKDLRVFAVHHRTRRDIQANEGVLFEHIKGASQ